MRRSSSIATILLLAAPFAAPGSTAAGQRLAYALPSPATAAYQLTDNTSMTISGSPMGPMEFTGGSTFNYALTFAAGGDGVRVSAELSAFEAQMNSPMGPQALSQTLAGVASGFEVLLAGRGLADIVTESRRADGELPILVDPHAVLFPTLPGGDVGTGDAWVDTVTVGVGEGGERVVVLTYTLEGEATHDGRPHLRIAVSGESRLTMAEQGASMDLTGSESGYYLWDTERGLMALAELSRSHEGRMTAPDGTSVRIEFTATTRITMEN